MDIFLKRVELPEDQTDTCIPLEQTHVLVHITAVYNMGLGEFLRLYMTLQT